MPWPGMLPGPCGGCTGKDPKTSRRSARPMKPGSRVSRPSVIGVRQPDTQARPSSSGRTADDLLPATTMSHPSTTRILTVDPDQPDPATLEEAGRVLRGGGLVAFATETVYGLGAIATDEKAVARIFAAKGRPPTNPVIVHAAALAQARDCV